MHYWLFKSEADCYSIDDLKRDKHIAWEGIRNYQSRNFMMRDMQAGDKILFYHSSSDPTAVVGVAQVSKSAHPDETQFNKKSEYYDPKATRDKPRWYCVDVAFVSKFKTPMPLPVIKIDPKLEGMMVREQGSRLSIQPVSQKHFEYIVGKGR